jgi:hypothetical protein
MEVKMTIATFNSLFISKTAQSVCPNKATKFRYIIMHPKSVALPINDRENNLTTRTLNDKVNISFADLTRTEATQIQTFLDTHGGSIKLNAIHKVRDPLSDTTTVEAVQATSSSAYPSAPLTCPKTTISNDFVMFFPDTMVNVKNFKGDNLHIGNNYSGSNKPCNPHSDYTYSIFQQVLGDKNLKSTNIPVFSCGGAGTTQAFISAFLDIIDFAKQNPTIKVAVYFAVSGGLLQDSAYTAVIQEVVNAGILLAVSAGNNGKNLCNANIPPWNVPGVLQIGGTNAPGNCCPYFTNWSDVYPQSQFGDCVTAYLPSVFKIKQFNVNEQGTSFAVPQALAIILKWWNQNPTATAAQVIKAFTNFVATIPAQETKPYPPMTPTKDIRVVATADYCNMHVSNTSTIKPN